MFTVRIHILNTISNKRKKNTRGHNGRKGWGYPLTLLQRTITVVWLVYVIFF